MTWRDAAADTRLLEQGGGLANRPPPQPGQRGPAPAQLGDALNNDGHVGLLEAAHKLLHRELARLWRRVTPG